MTNEEKANEIAQLADYTHHYRDIDIAFKSAMEMADWKDKQYQLEIDDLLKRLHEAEEREKIATKIINEKNNELNELRK